MQAGKRTQGRGAAGGNPRGEQAQPPGHGSDHDQVHGFDHGRDLDEVGTFEQLVAEPALSRGDDRADVPGDHDAKHQTGAIPIDEITSPWSRKTRRMVPVCAPMVRRMAMSACLSVTAIVWPDTMLNAATATTMSRMRNIMTFSSRTASNSSP
jgi:hypothetical protein